MKGLALAIKGFEDICAKEIEELIKVKGRIGDHVVTFETKDHYDFCKLCYVSQSVAKAGPLLLESDFKSIESIKKLIKKIDFSIFGKEDFVFAVKSLIKNPDIESTELSAEVGDAIIESLDENKIKYKVNLDEPKLLFYSILINDKFYLMLDFAGFDLAKRDYRLFQSPFAIKGSLAYCLLRLADIKENETIMDLFSGNGVIPIEAAIYFQKKPIQFYQKEQFKFMDLPFLDKNKSLGILEDYDKKAIKDKKTEIHCIDSNFHNISNAKKNAKAAGVEKSVSFSRTAVDWLDTKFGKGKVHKIVTYLPSPSKIKTEKDIEKIFKEFFYQTEYVLSKEGLIAVLIDKDELFKERMAKERFQIVSAREVFQGEKMMKVLVIKKN